MDFITGTCPYCGQAHMLKETVLTQEDASKEALRMCNCAEALKFQNSEKVIHDGIENIELLFGENCSDYGFAPIEYKAIDLLKEMISIFNESGIKKASFRFSDGTKANITFSDIISIERSKNKKIKLEG